MEPEMEMETEKYGQRQRWGEAERDRDGEREIGEEIQRWTETEMERDRDRDGERQMKRDRVRQRFLFATLLQILHGVIALKFPARPRRPPLEATFSVTKLYLKLLTIPPSPNPFAFWYL